MTTPAIVSKNAVLLAIFAALTTAATALTYTATKGDIARAEREAELRQLYELFPENSHSNALIDDTITLPSNAPLLGNRVDRLAFRARNKDGEVIGLILPATARDGYSGDIKLIVGIDRQLRLAGVRVVEHHETPGLGDAIEARKSDWIHSFVGRSLSDPQPARWTVKKNGGAFDQFTGATVTPRAVVLATRRALEYASTHRDTLFELSPAQQTNTTTETSTND